MLDLLRGDSSLPTFHRCSGCESVIVNGFSFIKSRHKALLLGVFMAFIRIVILKYNLLFIVRIL